MVDDGALLRSEDDVNLVVARLKGDRVRKGILPFSDVPPEGVRTIQVGRECRRERRALIHMIVIDEQQIAAPQFDKINCSVRLRKLRVAPLAPRASAVARFGAHQVTIGGRFVISTATAVCNEVIIIDLNDGWLDVPFGRANASRLLPAFSLHIVEQK